MDCSLTFPLDSNPENQFHSVQFHAYQPLPSQTFQGFADDIQPGVLYPHQTHPDDPSDADPDANAQPASPTTPRKSDHIPRPRNAFMIFRSEYVRTKITRSVEHDHRHISRIIAYCWKKLSDEEKAVYQRRAEEEKAEHKRKHPDYKYSPVTRVRVIHRRNVKRNGADDIERCEKIGDLLLAGKAGTELESALKEIEQPDAPNLPGPSSRDPFSYANRSPGSPDVPAFRYPLLPSPKTPTRALPTSDLYRADEEPYPTTPTRSRYPSLAHSNFGYHVSPSPELHYHPYSPHTIRTSYPTPAYSSPSPSPRTRTPGWGPSESDELRYPGSYQDLATRPQPAPSNFTWVNPSYPTPGASPASQSPAPDSPAFIHPFATPFSGRRPSAPVDPLDRSPLTRNRR